MNRDRGSVTGPSSGSIVDLFAGAGGWEEGLRQLGHRAIGIELDQWACATAEAAGHQRLRSDVVALDPARLGPVWGLIGSPPCQAYSTAGRNLGRLDRAHVIACAHELAAGHDSRAEHAVGCLDPRSLLTVEPLRWTLALRPRWVALEQVPAVLELWTLFAGLLATHGYQSAVGVLSAERYGVPQTRKRAFLIASLDGPVRLPAATHRSYDPRHPDRVRDGEEQLAQWVNMATALGWPTPAVACTHANTNHGRRPRGVERPITAPASTLDTSAGAWTIEPPEPPAPPDGLDPRTTHARVRPTSRPATTMTAGGLAHGGPVWAWHRPATTVLCDPRIQPPGHKRNAGDPPGRYGARSGRRSVRITERQASLLQGFRADYPWQGTRARRFAQIGNAVCPPLATAVLREAMQPSLKGEKAGTR